MLFEKQFEEFTAEHSNVAEVDKFDCNTEGVMCRDKTVKSGWLGASAFLKKHESSLSSGMHSDCAYECRLSSSAGARLPSG